MGLCLLFVSCPQLRALHPAGFERGWLYPSTRPGTQEGSQKYLLMDEQLCLVEQCRNVAATGLGRPACRGGGLTPLGAVPLWQTYLVSLRLGSLICQMGLWQGLCGDSARSGTVQRLSCVTVGSFCEPPGAVLSSEECSGVCMGEGHTWP